MRHGVGAADPLVEQSADLLVRLGVGPLALLAAVRRRLALGAQQQFARHVRLRFGAHRALHVWAFGLACFDRSMFWIGMSQ